jgi:protein-disulfide isomerase
VPAQQILHEYVETGRVNILYRHFPFIGDESWRAAEASECAGEQDRFHVYEETIYVNWNGENQGAYSDENLRIFAEVTGISSTSSMNA